MNKLNENVYVLHNVWGSICDKFYKYNLKYFILPILYLVITLIVVPKNISMNTIEYTEFNTYVEINITREDKIAYILDKYNININEFKILCGIVLSEAENNSYEDAYAVINTIYNRTHSKKWVKSIEKTFGQGKGTNLYYQAIAPGQFTVYASNTYLRNIDNTESMGYDAIIDFLYTEKIMHNYLSFRGKNIKINNSETFSEKGNNYFNVLDDENRI